MNGLLQLQLGAPVSRRKTDTLGDLAAGAAAGRRVVASVGQLDGAFLAALQRLQLAPLGDQVSTWADGIGDNHLQVKGGTDGKDQVS